MNDTTNYWRLWSKAVEKGFIKYFDKDREGKDAKRSKKGRGEIKIVDVGIKKEDRSDEADKEEDILKAIKNASSRKNI